MTIIGSYLNKQYTNYTPVYLLR